MSRQNVSSRFSFEEQCSIYEHEIILRINTPKMVIELIAKAKASFDQKFKTIHLKEAHMPVVIILPVLQTAFVAAAATLAVKGTNDLYNRISAKS